MNINPVSSNYFHVCHSPDGRCQEDDLASDDASNINLHPPVVDPMDFVIARHGLESSEKLLAYWQEQKANGNLDF